MIKRSYLVDETEIEVSLEVVKDVKPLVVIRIKAPEEVMKKYRDQDTFTFGVYLEDFFDLLRSVLAGGVDT